MMQFRDYKRRVEFNLNCYFAFSAIQKVEQDSEQKKPMYCIIDNQEHEYTEMIADNNLDIYYTLQMWINNHKSRYIDSMYLGQGEVKNASSM